MIRILFVCLGNICRSPMCELYMKDIISRAGLSDRFYVESAATSSEELGNPVYPPAQRKLNEHGISASGKTARQITKSDYDRFDYIIGMEESNRRSMLRIFGGDPDDKISLLLDWTVRPGAVADPWYTGDFEATWRDVSEGCGAIMRRLVDERS
ncbi:MAG: low molecular weight phosphotyrosine protein phosphatase [Oscillospiraceae bacterium]|nr:low molecular weight phosphotyrosine protein phosphatase [Oscillospiraceae bacterium]